MKLSAEQLAELQEELRYAVKYKETYDEIYDHILSTIDTYNDEAIYVTSVTKQIIDQDFGGYDTLKKTEKSRVKLITFAMRKKHWQHMLQFFNFPMAAFTIAITIAAYFMSANPDNRKILLGFVAVSSFTPLLFVAFKKLASRYRAWYFDNYQPQSIKENYIVIAALLSNSMFNLLSFAGHRLQTNAAVTVVVFVIYMVYVLSFFKLYQDEFKMQLT
jgi:hypothetical protein